MSKTNVLIAMVVVAFALLPVALSETAARRENDPVWVALKAYSESANEMRELENPSLATKMAHFQEWRERFEKVVEENPQSRYVESAKVKLLGLSNGLSDFKNSQKILQDMISQTDNPHEKIRWWNESGEVNRARYGATQDQDDAQKSLDAFAQAHALYLSLPPESQTGDIAGDQIVALCMAGNVSKVFNDPVKSATLFRTARELFQTSKDAAMYAVLVHYDLEIIAELEMCEWIRAEKESDALNCLDILSKLTSYRWSPSYYALKYASLQYETSPRGFQDFVSKWLDQHDFDERTPILMAYLGFSYFDNGLYEKSLPLYEVLRDKHRADFQKLQPDAFRDGKGGCYDRILADLAAIYLKRGHIDEADKLRNELKELLPKSANIEILSNTMPKPATVHPIEQRNVRYLIVRATLIVVGLVLIIFGLYFRWFGNER